MKRVRWLIVMGALLVPLVPAASSAAADTYCGSKPQYESVMTYSGSADGTRYAKISISGDHASWAIKGGYRQCSFSVIDNYQDEYNGGHSTRSFTTPDQDTIMSVQVYVAQVFTVSLTQSASSIPLHRSVSFSGTVTPHNVGAYVYLQQLTSSGWTSVVRTTEDKYGHYRFSRTFGKKGKYQFRAYKPASSKCFAGSSRTVTVSVT